MKQRKPPEELTPETIKPPKRHPIAIDWHRLVSTGQLEGITPRQYRIARAAFFAGWHAAANRFLRIVPPERLTPAQNTQLLTIIETLMYDYAQLYQQQTAKASPFVQSEEAPRKKTSETKRKSP